jgi:hypothetical protein
MANEEPVSVDISFKEPATEIIKKFGMLSLYEESEKVRKSAAKSLVDVLNMCGFDVKRVDNMDNLILINGIYDRRVTNPYNGKPANFLPNELLGKKVIFHYKPTEDYKGKTLQIRGYDIREMLR